MPDGQYPDEDIDELSDSNPLFAMIERDGSHFPSYPQREIEMVAEKMEAEFAKLMPITYGAFQKSGRIAP